MGAAGLLLGGTAISAYGTYQSGREQERQYAFQSQIQKAQSEAEARNLERQSETDRFNAELAEEEAKNIMLAASLNEDYQRRVSRNLLASQRASLVQAGMAGTFAGQKLAEQSAVDAEKDALMIRYDGILKKGTLQAEAGQLREQAEFSAYNAEVTRRIGTAGAANLLASGKQAKRAGTLGAAATLLGGYGKYKAGT